jgi:hypothetical protein
MGEITKRENEWQDRATAAAIKAARRMVLGDAAVIPMMTPVGRLSEVQWGWIVAAVLFAWISMRAQQAASEGSDIEKSIRDGMDNAWDAGAIVSILPALADRPGVDWSKPLVDWSHEQIIAFLAQALRLVQQAMAARDRVPGITRKPDDTLLSV